MRPGPNGECDYYSENGIDPRFWGPSVWLILHTTAAAFPCTPTPEDRNRVNSFVRSLAKNLPCGSCRFHFTAAISEGGSHPLTSRVLKDRFSFFAWTISIHNVVNKRLGKKVVEDPDAWFRLYAAHRGA